MEKGQRAALAVEFERIEAEAAKARMVEGRNQHSSPKANLPEGSTGQARDKAAELFGVGGRSVQDAMFVAKKDPELFDRIKTGEVAPSRGAKDLRDKLNPKPVLTTDQLAAKEAA